MWQLLYVDDEEDIRSVAQMAIELDGDLRVRLLDDPRKAVEMAAREDPHLILLDFRMPEMDGLAVLEALRRDPRTCRTPIVFLTASVQQHEIRGLIEAGAAGVIEKPFNPMTLAQEVRAFLPEQSRSARAERHLT